MLITVSECMIMLAVLYPAPKDLPEIRVFKGQNSDEFQKTFDELRTKDWRLRRIKGYEKAGESYYDGEWYKPATPLVFRCHHGMDRNAYHFRTTQLTQAGYTEVLKSTWRINGEDRFWAVWEVK